MITFAILTVSDSCSSGEAIDSSGPAIAKWIQSNEKFKGSVLSMKCVSDDEQSIKKCMIDFCDKLRVDVVLTTGGTGFASRDITPEATKAVLDKEAPGLVIAMIKGSLQVTEMAMLSRPVCGIRGKTVIMNVPGSKKAAIECLNIVAPVISHAVDLLKDNQEEIKNAHQEVQKEAVFSALPDCKSRYTVHDKYSSRSQEHQCSHNLQHASIENSDAPSHDPSKVALRHRISPYPVVPMETALRTVLNYSQLNEVETVNFMDCTGRILADDILASDPIPPFPASIKDGYAVIASDGIGIRKVLGSSNAGSEPGALHVTPGFCVQINTGAPIPKGADAVVQVEDTKLISSNEEGTLEEEIEILVAPQPAKDIRAVGSDIAKGETVLRRNSKIGYSELGILAMIGVTEIPVYKLSSVAVLSTGNELVHPGSTLKPGQIRDSNKTLLMALLRDHGFPAIDMGIAKDEVDDIVTKIRHGFEVADILVSSGGVSMGDKDMLKSILKTHFSAKLHFGRVFLKPGLPTTFATVIIKNRTKLFFGLPGNPVSAAVTCNVFVIPALRKMCGHLNPEQTIIKAKITSKVELDPRPEFQRVILKWTKESEIPTADVTGNQISCRLTSMSNANGLLFLPPKTDQLKHLNAGQIVDCMIIGRI